MNIRVTPINDGFVKEMSQYSDEVTIDKNGFLFFWGGWPSQWEFCRFHINGIMYNTAEQYMMAEKARLFGDEELLEKILESPYPKAQKGFGRKVRGYDDAAWVAESRKVVFEGNLAKFSQNEDMKKRLLGTKDFIIVEASPYDKRWGIGRGVEDPNITNPKTWRGMNWLGEELMRVRQVLRYTNQRVNADLLIDYQGPC